MKFGTESLRAKRLADRCEFCEPRYVERNVLFKGVNDIFGIFNISHHVIFIKRVAGDFVNSLLGVFVSFVKLCPLKTVDSLLKLMNLCSYFPHSFSSFSQIRCKMSGRSTAEDLRFELTL